MKRYPAGIQASQINPYFIIQGETGVLDLTPYKDYLRSLNLELNSITTLLGLNLCTKILFLKFNQNNNLALPAPLDLTNLLLLNHIDIGGTPLATFDFDNLPGLKNLRIQDFDTLAGATQSTLNFLNSPLLEGVEIGNSSNISAIDFTSAQGSLLYFSCANTSVPNFNFGNFTVLENVNNLTQNDLCTSIIFSNNPALENITQIDSNAILASVSASNLPALLTAVGINNNPLLTFVDVSICPSLTTVQCNNNALLDTLVITGCPLIITCEAQNGNLTQPVVDAILIELDNNGLNNGTVQLAGGTSATPSLAGLAAAANLTGKGWIVQTN